ncbi:MAG: calcium/proton exchanger [Ktedonobacteraceae bacterium]
MTVIFVFAALSLIPLAALIGLATENLAHYLGPTAGGLLNATFGNAPEIIIGIFALRQGLIFVVKASIAGSIISNALLVLGGSFAIGGWRWGRQYYNSRDVGQFSAMLVLSVAGLLIPFTASIDIPQPELRELISVGISIVLLAMYVAYLSFHVFRWHSRRRNPRNYYRGKPRITRPLHLDLERSDAEESEVNPMSGGVDLRETEVAPLQPLWITLVLLLLATIGTAWNSELLVGTIVPVASQLGWSPFFISLVIIPIVGNAAEHSSALLVAYKDRIQLSIAIAAGSSIQVATLVAPILVLISLFYPRHLDLVFQPLEIGLLALAALLFRFVCIDGETTWLAGLQLLAVYLMACIVFFFLPNPGP